MLSGIFTDSNTCFFSVNKTSDQRLFASSPNRIFLPHFKKASFNQGLACPAPKHWSKYTTLYSPSTIFDVYVFLTHSNCPAHKLFPSSVPVLTALLVGKSSRLLGMLHNFQVKTFQSTTHCCGQLIVTLKSMTSHKSAAHYYFLI